MRRMIILILLVIVIVLPQTWRSAAQGNPECDPAGVIKEAQGLDTSGSPVADLDQLEKLKAHIESQEKACATTDSTETPGPTYTPSIPDTPEPSETPVPTLSAKDIRAATATAVKATAVYLADFKPIDRRELVAYPERHNGEQLIVQGRVFNIIDDYTFQIYLANSYDAAVIQSNDLLQGLYVNDFVKVYGLGAGVWTGTNSYGASIEQPLILAALIKKQ